MATGTVKWFDRKKGFGFLVGQDGGPDIFIHFSSIEGEGFRTLRHGDRVEYELVDSERGPQAHSIRLLDKTS